MSNKKISINEALHFDVIVRQVMALNLEREPFFPAKKLLDECWEVVAALSLAGTFALPNNALRQPPLPPPPSPFAPPSSSMTVDPAATPPVALSRSNIGGSAAMEGRGSGVVLWLGGAVWLFARV